MVSGRTERGSDAGGADRAANGRLVSPGAQRAWARLVVVQVGMRWIAPTDDRAPTTITHGMKTRGRPASKKACACRGKKACGTPRHHPVAWSQRGPATDWSLPRR